MGHYFIFKDDDHCVKSLYHCDYPPAEADWWEFLRNIGAQGHRIWNEMIVKWRIRTNGVTTFDHVRDFYYCHSDYMDSWRSSEEYATYNKWVSDNEPEKMFVKLHEMTRCDFTELG